MKIAIYQINRERDGKRVMFLDYARMKKRQGGIDSSIYDRVFDGEVPCEELEDVYRMFNLNVPEGFGGRSLSVSDVVEIGGAGRKTYYYCDGFGFRRVSFDSEKAVRK